MRKKLITSAMILGGFGAQSFALTYKGAELIMKLSHGKHVTIEVQKDEIVEEALPEQFLNVQHRLSNEAISFERMVSLLNNIIQKEEEIQED